MSEQSFRQTETATWQDLEQFSGTAILPLAEPVANGSIHKLRLSAGTVIPSQVHPGDEYVYVIEGTMKTGGVQCNKGCFWFTPAKVKQGLHEAVTDVEILTIRLGAMGTFTKLPD